MNARRAALRTLAAVALLPSGAARAADADSLTRIDDLRALADGARRARLPLLLFFSMPGCPFCLEVRRSYLAPRVRDGGALIREIDFTSTRALTGLDGRPLTESEFAARYGVRVVPVVLLVDPDLAALGDPLVGLDRSGYYEAYLQSAIDAATAKLQAR